MVRTMADVAARTIRRWGCDAATVGGGVGGHGGGGEGAPCGGAPAAGAPPPAAAAAAAAAAAPPRRRRVAADGDAMTAPAAGGALTAGRVSWPAWWGVTTVVGGADDVGDHGRAGGGGWGSRPPCAPARLWCGALPVTLLHAAGPADSAVSGEGRGSLWLGGYFQYLDHSYDFFVLTSYSLSHVCALVRHWQLQLAGSPPAANGPPRARRGAAPRRRRVRAGGCGAPPPSGGCPRQAGVERCRNGRSPVFRRTSAPPGGPSPGAPHRRLHPLGSVDLPPPW